MQISSRLTIAVHVITCIDTFSETHKVTSEFLAKSVNVNPVVIRRLLSQLKSAGLISVTRGSGGAEVARPLEAITVLDVYRAVECVERGQLFRFHENPNTQCPVGRNIHAVLDDRLVQIQDTMEREMATMTMADIVRDTKALMAAEAK